MGCRCKLRIFNQSYNLTKELIELYSSLYYPKLLSIYKEDLT